MIPFRSSDATASPDRRLRVTITPSFKERRFLNRRLRRECLLTRCAARRVFRIPQNGVLMPKACVESTVSHELRGERAIEAIAKWQKGDLFGWLEEWELAEDLP